MKISQHLTLAELTRSESAKRLGISNMPTPEHIENLKQLAENIFEPIRNHFGSPIYISSGYRSQALNAAIGGSMNSQHSRGMAIDIDMDGTDIKNSAIFEYAKTLPFDQLIWEFGTKDNPDWVHISYSPLNRKQILYATKRNGKTIYNKG
jgi:zinc D-Ala-D-Ala carboxypeptidase